MYVEPARPGHGYVLELVPVLVPVLELVEPVPELEPVPEPEPLDPEPEEPEPDTVEVATMTDPSVPVEVYGTTAPEEMGK